MSLGSKKNKTKRANLASTKSEVDLGALAEEEHEVAANRLLRSSSARYAVVAEVDYHSLPPLRQSF